MPPVERGPSGIAGAGLFAAERVCAGSNVVALDRLGELNHSCQPNVGWSATGALVAMVNIEAGTELTTDYALHIDDPGLVLFCHCETYRCRQVIEGTDWQIPQLQLRYAGYWSPALQRHITQAAGG